ncbi:MAG TPA: MFS transporter, partial [Methanospirillum sp.]|uniref:MFS transporter n=1 Tax=Methanospirillum sp. TaxID=45200 RepID=UPI002C7F241F
MANLDAVMVNVALPTITVFFTTELALSQWTVTGYILMMTSLLIIVAKLSEYTGITRLYIAGWGLFTLSSLACGFTETIVGLIFFRIIQGIGASMVYCGMGPLIIHASEPSQRGQVMGYITTAIACATFIGPGLGGFITELLGWQYIFLVNVPIGIFLIICCLKYLNIQEKRTES